jgi:hypothetical protein
VDVCDQLLHRFLPNGDVLGDFAAITLQMDRVNQQDVARRDFVGGKGKSTRGHECSIWVPHFEPGAQRRDTTGNCDLLSDILTFSRRKIRNNVNLEAGEGRDGNGCIVKITHLFHSDHVCIDPANVSMNRRDLRPFRRHRGIGVSAGKPLNIPKRHSHGLRGSGRWSGGLRTRISADRKKGDENDPSRFRHEPDDSAN